MRLVDDLAELTGEELGNLILALHAATSRTETLLLYGNLTDAERPPIAAVSADLLDVLADTMAQLGRITVPFREAAAIIWRTRYSRGHPVRMVTP